MSRKERLIKEIKENKWGIILGGVWGLINVHNLIFTTIFNKNFMLFWEKPLIYFFLHIPLLIFNLFWFIFIDDESFLSLSFRKESNSFYIISIIIGFFLLCIGILLGYLIEKFKKNIKSRKISLKKEMKENIIGIILGALWGESFIVLFFFLEDLIGEIPYPNEFFMQFLILLPMNISQSLFLIVYGANPFKLLLQGKIPTIISSHGQFLGETLLFSFFIGIFLGYSINKFIKKVWRWRK